MILKNPFQSKNRALKSIKAIGVFVLAALLMTAGSAETLSAAVGTSYAELAARVKHSVVNISTTKVVQTTPFQGFGPPNSPMEEFFEQFFGNLPSTQRKATALGSGFLIDEQGLILTNNHVIEKADQIKVVLQNQKEFDAEVVGTDPKTDLALIRIAAKKQELPEPVSFGNSDALRVGDQVMAVGNPFGLGHTVTVGIVSAKGRVIGAGPYDDFLQTDAAINPGNSGGPLFNMAGEVVGINTAIVATGQGIGFAIPIDLAEELLPQLKTGSVTRGWIGVVIQDLTPELADSFNLDTDKGVLVADVVKAGPADEAGLRRGDAIIAVEGEKIENAHELSRKVAGKKPGTRLDVQIVREQQKKTITVKLGAMPDQMDQAGKAQKGEKEQRWGLTVQPLTPMLAQRLGYQNETGVVVTAVVPDSPAAEAELRPGDLIQEIDRKKIENRKDMVEAIENARDEDSLLVLVMRGNATFYVVLKQNQK